MEKHIICFGDSVTRGENDPKKGGWVDRLKTFCINKFLKTREDEICVFNMGIGGETTEGLIKRFRNEFEMRLSVDGNNIVIFAYGTNDLALANHNHNVSEEQFQSNLNSCIDYALNKNAKVFLLNILPVIEPLTSETSDLPHKRKRKDIIRYNHLILSLANEKKAGYIDVFSPFDRKKEELLTFDGLHPNSKGHKLIYKVVKKAVFRDPQ